MSLFAELARPPRKVVLPFLPKGKCALEREADKVQAAFGGVPKDPNPGPEALSAVITRLTEGARDPSLLKTSELKLVPYVLWGPDPSWRADATFIGRYLQQVNLLWRAGARRIWRHYALYFDEGSPATRIVAAWLRERLQRLPVPLRAFTERYRLLDVDDAAGHLAVACLSGEEAVGEMAGIGITPELFRESWLCVSVLRSAGQILEEGQKSPEVIERLRMLLANNVRRAIAGSTCSEALRAAALRSLVEGLVTWETGKGGASKPEKTLAFLLELNGDPRFVPDRWKGRVADSSVRTVEGWLTRETIEAFFRVIDALKTDRDEMWQARRQFWLGYLPYVTGAWLIAGPEAERIARRQKLGRFATFERQGIQKDHCGLLLSVGPVHVLEMNMNGSAIFWRETVKHLPGLFQETYNRSVYLDNKDDRNVVARTHRGAWQQKFSEEIHSMGGPLLRPRW